MRRITIASILLLFFTLISKYLIAQKPAESKFKEDGVYVSLHAGLSIDRMKTFGYLIDYLEFDRPTQLYLSAVIDWDMGNIDELKGFILRTEIDYKPLHFHASGYPHTHRYDEYEIKARTIAPVVLILYRVPWRWKLRPYGGIGAGMMWSNVSTNTLTIHYNEPYYVRSTQVYENDFDLDDNNYVVVYTAGLMFGRRYDLNCKFWRAKWSRSDDDNHQLNQRSIILSFGYRF